MTETYDAALPPAFADLALYADGWGASTTDARNDHRHHCSMAEIRQFYDAMTPRLDAALGHLDAFNVKTMPDAERNCCTCALAISKPPWQSRCSRSRVFPASPTPQVFFNITRELI